MNFQIPFYEEGFDQIIIHRFENEFVNDVFIGDCKSVMDNFDQLNPHHNKTLGEHCKFTADLFKNKNYPHQYIFAANLHDVGKLYTKKIDEDGVGHYYQHENVGCYYLLGNESNIRQCSDMNDDEFLDILFLVNYHMMPMSWENDKTKTAWSRRFGEYKYQILLDFNECDKAR